MSFVARTLVPLQGHPLRWGVAIAISGLLVYLSFSHTPNSPQAPGPSRMAHGPDSTSDLAPTEEEQDPSPRAADAATSAVTLDDGSRAVPTRPNSRLELVRQSPAQVLFRLNEGSADFSVTPNSSRSFRVESGNVLVEVVGTKFSVTRHDPERTQVAVESGRVRVHWKSPDGRSETTVLDAGDEATFPPPRPDLAREPEEPSWKQLAKRGKMKEAYAALDGLKTPLVDRPEELLLAADVARQSGHPGRAAGYLEQILQAHSGDPRASVAAFTLGRVQLSLSSPAKAARAFEKARLLAPGGALAEDALAHEAQAHRQAGALAAARQAASRYLRMHPKGVHAETMRSLASDPSSSDH